MPERGEQSFQPDEERLSEMEALIAANLEMMRSRMQETLLFEETTGGTAVEVDDKWFPSARVNGYAERDTGRIVEFGNIYDVSDAARQHQEFGYQVAVNIHGADKIVELFGRENFLEQAVKVLEESSRRWNEEQETSMELPEER